ncbi:MAG TPA: phage tail protein [Kofleriaceae bacterium]
MAKSNPDGVYAAAHFGLELDGKQEVSLFRSIEGGGVKADVMTYQYGINDQNGGYHRFRLLGKPKFEDIKLQVGMSMSGPFYDWIAAFFKGQPLRKNGAIIAGDFYYKERARRTFMNAMIKELTFPKLDANDKNPVYMNVGLAVESIEFAKGSGNAMPTQAKNFDDKQKHWTANNFHFQLDDYADACRRVVKVDSFTIKQNIIEHHYGGFKAAIKTPSAVEFPNLVFYIPENDAQPLAAHMQKRVGFGADSGNGEVRNTTTMHGQLDVYDNELKPIFTLEFFGADIISITPEKADAGSEELKLVKVELYTEKMTFKYV